MLSESASVRMFVCVFVIMYRIVFLVAGCEFFKEYKDNDYDPEGLQFDWSQVLYLPYTVLHKPPTCMLDNMSTCSARAYIYTYIYKCIHFHCMHMLD